MSCAASDGKDQSERLLLKRRVLLMLLYISNVCVCISIIWNLEFVRC